MRKWIKLKGLFFLSGSCIFFKGPQFFFLVFAYCGGSPAHRLTDGSAPHLAFSTPRRIPTSPALCKWSYPAPQREGAESTSPFASHTVSITGRSLQKVRGHTPLWERLVSPSVLHTTSFPPRLSCGINSKFLECSWHLYEFPVAAVTNDSKINNREILIYYLHLLPQTYYPTSSGNQKFGCDWLEPLFWASQTWNVSWVRLSPGGLAGQRAPFSCWLSATLCCLFLDATCISSYLAPLSPKAQWHNESPSPLQSLWLFPPYFPLLLWKVHVIIKLSQKYI